MNNKHTKLVIALVCLALICGAGIAAYMGRDNLPVIGSIGAPGLSDETKDHILIGDKSGGGGHKFGAGRDCKSEFPKSWDDAKIINNIKKVAANDNLKWKKQGNGYYAATQRVDGVRVRVILDKERDDIVTGYPVSTKRNACPARTAAKAKTAPASTEEATKVEPAAGIANSSNRQPRTSNINKKPD